MSKQSVNLTPEVVREIQQRYLDTNGSTKGALQEALARGAELVLDELRGARVTPNQVDLLAGLSPAERARVQTLIDQIRDKKKIREIPCPEELQEAAVGFIRYFGEKPASDNERMFREHFLEAMRAMGRK